MGVLDKYGAGGLVRGANGMVNPPKDPNANTGADAGASGKGAPPAPPQKKGGVSGLISGKVSRESHLVGVSVELM